MPVYVTDDPGTLFCSNADYDADASMAALYPNYPDPDARTIICDLCGKQSFGLISVLKRLGWGIYKRDSFCPQCEADV